MHSMRVRLSVQNFFVQETSKNVSHTTCNYCLRKGHISHLCPLKKSNTKIIQVWIPKGTRPQNIVQLTWDPNLTSMQERFDLLFCRNVLKASEEQFTYICQELGMINIDA